MTTVNENGVTYEITDGRVVTATTIKEVEPVSNDLAFEDRVKHGKKEGKVVSLIPSIYGQSVGVRYDDGSFSEHLQEDLERIESLAKTSSNASLKDEYDEYVALPIDTLDEVEAKIRIARSLHSRARAGASERDNSLTDSYSYDTIVTATSVDLIDLKDQQEKFRVAESQDYLEAQPQYFVPEEIEGAYGLTRGGDASWLGAEEFEVEPVDEAFLAQTAAQMVSSLTKTQLDDRDFIKQALKYRYESLPNDQATKVKFAALVKEAVKAKFAAPESTQKTASVVQEHDLDGNEINLDDIEIEAVFS